jgi:hypothetical protein
MSAERNRSIYHNSSEHYHKDSATIFHSPFSGGRRNSEYANPTFMSSSIFYPVEYSSNCKQASVKPARQSQPRLDEYLSAQPENVPAPAPRRKPVSALSLDISDPKCVNQDSHTLRKKMLSSVMRDIENCLNRP